MWRPAGIRFNTISVEKAGNGKCENGSRFRRFLVV
jgi:hypothetical protein